LTAESIGTIDEMDSCNAQGKEMKEAWKRNKNKSKYPLIRCVYDCYKWQILFTVLISWLCVYLETYNIYILREVMSYIEGGSDDMNRALLFVVIMSISELSSQILRNFIGTLQNTISHRSYVGIQKLLYSKIFSISSATNKKYKKGELNNLIESDPYTVCEIIWYIPNVSSFPVSVIAT